MVQLGCSMGTLSWRICLTSLVFDQGGGHTTYLGRVFRNDLQLHFSFIWEGVCI